MAIRGDSFSSVADIAAINRFVLENTSQFNSSTLPTHSEVEGFIDEVSGVLNVAISGGGFTPANIKANSTAKLSCDSFVRGYVSKYVQLSQPVNSIGEENEMAALKSVLAAKAHDFVDIMLPGWKKLGITVSDNVSDGLKFTGETIQADRTDPDDSTLEQPKFSRGQWDST
jgi:hypothetical protein